MSWRSISPARTTRRWFALPQRFGAPYASTAPGRRGSGGGPRSERSCADSSPPAGWMRRAGVSWTDLVPRGRVVLLGAGPGDPELITLRELRWLRRAEVVVSDHLVNPLLLEEAPPRALRIFAG